MLAAAVVVTAYSWYCFELSWRGRVVKKRFTWWNEEET